MKKYLIFLAMINLVGCIVIRDYYYISLEDIPGIELVSNGIVQLKNLTGNSEIPTGYTLNRSSYILNLSIGDISPNPHLNVSIESKNGETLSFNPKIDYSLASRTGMLCTSYSRDEDFESRFIFAWAPGCVSDDYDKVITFDVIDSEGKIIYQENIPFKLIKDGKYFLWDTL